MKTVALLLAGGASSRMGRVDKLLEPIGPEPLLRNRAQTCLDAQVDELRVVLAPNQPRHLDALAGLNLTLIHTEGSDLGLSHSLQCGAKGLRDAAVVIVLADLPDIQTKDLNKVIAAANAHPLAKIIRGADDTGKPGHPVLLRPEIVSQLADLSGDTGAQPLLKRHRRDTVLVPIGPAALNDLDTPEDWANWRAGQPK